jgi:hypothetical protein
VELALGLGDPSAGAAAVGVDREAGEQVASFAECVELVELPSAAAGYPGRFDRCAGAETIPAPGTAPTPADHHRRARSIARTTSLMAGDEHVLAAYG